MTYRSQQQHRRRWFRLLWLAVSMALAGGGMSRTAQSADVYYNITSVTSEYLSNAVRIKIDTDGTITATAGKWFGGPPYYYVNWDLVHKQTTMSWAPECYLEVDKIMLHMDHAVAARGSTADVSKYPVSLIRFITTDKTTGGVGVDVEVVLQKKMRIRQYNFGRDRMGYDAYWFDHHDPNCFEMTLSPDSRSLIITVASDRLPERKERRTLADIPESERELQVDGEATHVRIHARNEPLSEVVEAISRTTGVPVAVTEEAAGRVVNAELPDTSVEEGVARLADGYGLMLYQRGTTLVLSDAAQQASSSHAPVTSARVRVHNITARQAADLLPNFLASSLRIDEAGNALMVAGSEALVEKVAADVAKLDQPATGVHVRALFLESSSSRDLMARLGLHYENESFRASTTPEEGAVTYSSVGTPEAQLRAALRTLEAAQRVKTVGESSLTMVSGATGELFAGLNKYVTFLVGYELEPTAEPVSAGTKLTVTSWAGKEMVSLQAAAETKVIDAVDPMTGLPIINTRSVAGSYCLPSGSTIAIGGLQQTQTELTERKIPVLGSLPLIGKFFRTKLRQRSSSELTVLLTVTITEATRAETEVAPAAIPDEARPLPPGGVQRWQ